MTGGREEFARKTSGSAGQPSAGEVAAAAVWLCSDASSFITGAALPADGGKLAGMAPFRRS